jgi:outer membrane protein OmpA-like peptidoglycan-associated protein
MTGPAPTGRTRRPTGPVRVAVPRPPTPARHQDGSAPPLRDRRAEVEADRVAAALAAGRRPPPVGPHPGGSAVRAAAGPHDAPGTGQPLRPAERAFFERLLGADLRRVRVHDDAAAAVAAGRWHAAGYAAGEHVVLGADAGEPGSTRRAETLAHELAHVLQHRQDPAAPVRHQQERRPRGIGAEPPPEAFDVITGRSPEQEHLIFAQDRADLPRNAGAVLSRALRGHTGPVTVDIHGYASGEGPDEYNRNLSAHRAAAVSRALADLGLAGLLPSGSMVRLHAHGEISEFGPRPENRRAGILVTDGVPEPQPVTPPTGTGAAGQAGAQPLPGTQQKPGGRPGDQPRIVHIDWSQVGVGPGLGPIVPPVDPNAPRTPPVLTPPAGGWHYPHPTSPGWLQLTPPRTGLIDWHDMAQTYTEHGARLSLRDMSFLDSFGLQQYDLYRSIGFNDGQARWIANIITRRSAGVQLYLEGNTAYDRFLRQNELMGWPTVYSTPMIDVLDVLRRIREDKK